MNTRNLTIVLVAIMLGPIGAAAADPSVTNTTGQKPAQAKANALAAISKVVASTKTATWSHTTYEKKGDDVERTEGNAWWQGKDLQRIDVTSGRGEGRTVVLEGKRLDTGFLKFDYDNRMVLSLRGNTVRDNGYLDDMAMILEQKDAVVITVKGKNWVIDYTNGAGLPAKMWLNKKTHTVKKTETYENGKLVEKYEYSKVVYNPSIDEDTWDN